MMNATGTPDTASTSWLQSTIWVAPREISLAPWLWGEFCFFTAHLQQPDWSMILGGKCQYHDKSI